MLIKAELLHTGCDRKTVLEGRLHVTSALKSSIYQTLVLIFLLLWMLQHLKLIRQADFPGVLCPLRKRAHRRLLAPLAMTHCLVRNLGLLGIKGVFVGNLIVVS